MTLLHQAAQKAVEALKEIAEARYEHDYFNVHRLANAAKTELESALQQQPEPVAWLYTRVEDGRQILAFTPNPGSAGKWEPLYASPSTTRQQEVGSGWKLVPVEPTQEMVDAGDAEAPEPWRSGFAREMWSAMLAAAPSTPEKAGGEKVHYWCNKCGYGGPVQVGHQRPNGTGECGYMAASAYPAPPSPIPHPLPAQPNDGGEHG